DQSDNDPAIFWSYVIAALQTVQGDFDPGQRTLALLQSLQPLPVETVLAKLLNEIGALAHDIVLVLDDYHLITAPPIHQGIAFLLNHQPPQLHIVIAGRPPTTTASGVHHNRLMNSAAFSRVGRVKLGTTRLPSAGSRPTVVSWSCRKREFGEWQKPRI